MGDLPLWAENTGALGGQLASRAPPWVCPIETATATVVISHKRLCVLGVLTLDMDSHFSILDVHHPFNSYWGPLWASIEC